MYEPLYRVILRIYENQQAHKKFQPKIRDFFCSSNELLYPSETTLLAEPIRHGLPKKPWVGDCRSKCTRASTFGTLILQTVRTPQSKEGNPSTTGSRSVHTKIVLLSRSRVGDYRVLGKRRRMDRRVIGGGSGRHIACVGSVQVVNVAKVPHVFVKVNLVIGTE